MARDTGRVKDRTNSQTDNVVRDPVSGRPLHEFVVDPNRGPTVLPTEGDPLQEPGVPPAPHGKQPRRGPLLVFTVGADADLKQAAKDTARRVIDAQQRLRAR